ncbi:MAG: guanylate kinase [Clostridia bacterium]|nr:guanylate kinase [Clostridia bacterium]
MDKGRLIVFSGPSGVGKDTILKKLIESDDTVKLSISATTRPKREYEEEGKDYYFLSEDEFLKKVSENKMLEYAKYCSNYYGTPIEPIERWTNEGVDVILEIEVEGGQKVISQQKGVLSIFVMPPSFAVLKRRLEERKTDSEDIVLGRLNRAKEEISTAYKYDYIVVNDDIDNCVDDIKAIIKADKLKYKNMKNFIDGVMAND